MHFLCLTPSFRGTSRSKSHRKTSHFLRKKYTAALYQKFLMSCLAFYTGFLSSFEVPITALLLLFFDDAVVVTDCTEYSAEKRDFLSTLDKV